MDLWKRPTRAKWENSRLIVNIFGVFACLWHVEAGVDVLEQRSSLPYSSLKRGRLFTMG